MTNTQEVKLRIIHEIVLMLENTPEYDLIDRLVWSFANQELFDEIMEDLK